MSDDFQTPPTSPAARRRRLEEPPKSPFAKAVDAIKTTPKKLAALVNQASTSVQNVVKGASSVAIGLEDLMALSVDELALILQKGREAKEDQSMGNKDRSDFVITDGGCWISRRTANSRPHTKVTYKIGDPIDYAEFNSNVIRRLGSRRYRLYQVAAVYNLKLQYPGLSTATYVAYSRDNKLEASHVCKVAKRLTYKTVDGIERSVTMFEENKACFFHGHLMMEPDFINRSRIKCDGGESCDHIPKCMVV